MNIEDLIVQILGFIIIGYVAYIIYSSPCILALQYGFKYGILKLISVGCSVIFFYFFAKKFV